MAKKVAELERRRLATVKTKAKYGGKPFDWRRCATCMHMARFQMKAMGHKVPRMPSVRSAIRAKRELQARDVVSVIGLLDTLLPRIAPAEMRLGDLAAVPGVEGLDAVFINAAPRKFIGWREDAPTFVTLDIPLEQITAAWRL